MRFRIWQGNIQVAEEALQGLSHIHDE